MKNTKRALRRAHVERKKARVRTYQVAHVSVKAHEAPEEPDARRVGMLAATATPCSCSMCAWDKYDRAAARREERRELDADW